ncbi:MAG: hypothetical protein K0Q97_3122 [Bacillota bacterium]|jgi:hypothetical protein|nr:hypothetical protein [Bacillota bacterium]
MYLMDIDVNKIGAEEEIKSTAGNEQEREFKNYVIVVNGVIMTYIRMP